MYARVLSLRAISLPRKCRGRYRRPLRQRNVLTGIILVFFVLKEESGPTSALKEGSFFIV